MSTGLLTILRKRIGARYQDGVSRIFYRRPFRLVGAFSVISFTFDDFPRSAFTTGGSILRDHGAEGTFYASFGLMDHETVVGRIFSRKDLDCLLVEGHELGCHTFGHCHSWKTRPSVFEDSIVQNRETLNRLLPGIEFRTFSYPIYCPRPRTKRRAARHFSCCRAGGQMFNSGVTDANNLRAFFLEQSRDDMDSIKALIHRNAEVRGWLIFATHDIRDRPSPYGCTPAFFEGIVRSASDSGAKILPVIQAWNALRASDARNP